MRPHTTRIALRAIVLSATLVFPSIASAQHEGSGQWYLFGAAGGWGQLGGAQAGVGIGYERLLYKGLGAGAEVEGYGGSIQRTRYGGVLASVNGSYHLRNLSPSQKLVPFGTVGYSGVGICAWSECGGTDGFNFGGGFNYWMGPHRGLRVEVRDHVFGEGPHYHKWEMRVGFAF